MTHPAFFCELSHEGILRVQGPDAGKFLQGQLTCNLSYLDAGSSSLGARCTPKGRMLSSFRIVPLEDAFLLAMAAELLGDQLADLKKYAAFSKAQLTDDSANWIRFGLVGGAAALNALGLPVPTQPNQILLAGDCLLLAADEVRIELWAPAARQAQLREQLARQLPEAPLQAWLLWQIRAGIGQVFGATRELFIPQMINLQALGGVSFRKGCYTGQEIVARMQYLGKLKRRMYHLTLAGAPAPAVGSELFSPVHGSSVGEVVIAAADGAAVELLAVVQQDAAEDGRIHLGSLQGPALQLAELPYTLDKDREIQR
jgi:folate-binding protein YgfZ